MEFGTLPFFPTLDVFELLIVLALMVAIPYDVYNVREAWFEKERFLDDPDPTLRRLGECRWENTQLRLLALVTIAVLTVSGALVPSPLQLAAPATVDFQDMLNSFLQRVGLFFVVVYLTRKAVNDAVWRRYADRRWQERVDRERAAAEAAAEVGVPVVEAPAVVVAPAPEGGKD